jgi:hypothetical protein
MKTLTIAAFVALISATATAALSEQAPVTEKLAMGSYIVFAPSPQVWRVKVDPKTMNNATISGHFSVTAGTPKQIDVLVFNEENYMKWKNDEDDAERASAKPVASVMKSADGNINAKLTDAGYHYLVISDRQEYEGKKTVSAEITFQYDKR